MSLMINSNVLQAIGMIAFGDSLDDFFLSGIIFCEFLKNLFFYFYCIFLKIQYFPKQQKK
jgi:hypothetical protein